MIIDGSDMYSLREAAERSQYTEKTIRTYISQNKVDATRINGEWFVTKAGLTALLRKHNAGEPDPNADLVSSGPDPVPAPPLPTTKRSPDPSPVPEPKKRNHGLNGRSIHFISDEAVALYIEIDTMAKALQVPTRVLAYHLIREGLAAHASDVTELHQIEEKKKTILSKFT